MTAANISASQVSSAAVASQTADTAKPKVAQPQSETDNKVTQVAQKMRKIGDELTQSEFEMAKKFADNSYPSTWKPGDIFVVAVNHLNPPKYFIVEHVYTFDEIGKAMVNFGHIAHGVPGCACENSEYKSARYFKDLIKIKSSFLSESLADPKK